MNFLIDYSNGNFSLANQITSSCWGEVKIKNPNMDTYHLNLMRFGNDSKFNIETGFSIRSNSEGKNPHITISAYITDKDNKKQYVIIDSKCPMFKSNNYDIREAFICFLNTLWLFDDISEASTILETRDVFTYYDPEDFQKRVNEVSRILSKYVNNDRFNIREKVIKWLSQAMLKFGYSVEKNNQTDENFQDVFSTLNSLGYTVTKI